MKYMDTNDLRTMFASARGSPKLEHGPTEFPWEPHFAWRPVKDIHGKYLWLSNIYKRTLWYEVGDKRALYGIDFISKDGLIHFVLTGEK